MLADTPVDDLLIVLVLTAALTEKAEGDAVGSGTCELELNLERDRASRRKRREAERILVDEDGILELIGDRGMERGRRDTRVLDGDGAVEKRRICRRRIGIARHRLEHGRSDRRALLRRCLCRCGAAKHERQDDQTTEDSVHGAIRQAAAQRTASRLTAV